MPDSIKIEQLLADDSFIRWIEGVPSEAEKTAWDAWVKADPARKELVLHAKNIHDGFKIKPVKIPDSEVDEELQRLNASINKGDMLAGNPATPARWLFSAKQRNSYSAIAAGVLIIITSLSVVHFFFQNIFTENFADPVVKEVQTQFGEKKVLSLSDGSTITLNSNSSLKYSLDVRENLIEFWLKGEAYFEIFSDEDRKFDLYKVFTEDGLVQVTGTVFNVNTYQDGTEVVLEEGEVWVEVGGFETSGMDYRMKPGEWVNFTHKDEFIEMNDVDPELFTSWTQDKLMFDQTSLAEIAGRIENIYGVQFIIADDELKQMEISGSIPNDNLPIFIKSLEYLLERSIIHNDKIIHIE